MNIQSVLTILDKPKHPQDAFLRAMQLQERTGAHVDLVSMCWHPMAEAKEAFDLHQRRAIKKEIIRARREWQRSLVQPDDYRSRDLSLITAWSDDIAAWVTKELSKQPRNLLVKSVHKTHSLIHTSQDWMLLQQTPVPLLLTTNKAQAPSRKIIATIDLRHSDAVHQRLNHKVLDAAHQFAEMDNALVHCVCVLEFSRVLQDLDVVDMGAFKRKFVANKKAALAELLEPYDVPKSRIHLPIGKVGERVNQLSHKLNADLLVVGTHARPIKQRMHLGNSAERILSRASCDILAIPP